MQSYTQQKLGSSPNVFHERLVVASKKQYAINLKDERKVGQYNKEDINFITTFGSYIASSHFNGHGRTELPSLV